MEQEYTISTGMKILYSVLAVAIFGLFVFILTIHKNQEVSPIVYGLPFVFLAIGALFIVNIIRKKVVLSSYSIIYTSLFSTSELQIKDIKGYRTFDNRRSRTIILESNLPGTPNIRIGNYTDLGDNSELLEWVKANFKDLDAADLENEQAEVLHDASLGTTEEERTTNLKKAKRVAIAYNIAGAVLGVMLIVYNNRLNTILDICYPFAGMLLLVYYKGLIRFLSNPKRSVYPFISPGFIVPVLVLFFRPIAVYNIFQPDHLWLPALVVSGVSFMLLFFIGVNKSFSSIAGQIVLMLVITLLYGFGSILQINCVFDDSKLQVYPARVYDHSVSHGRSTSYYLTISEWGPQTKVRKISVGRRIYQNTVVGDTVKVNFKSGKLGIPWYTISK